MAKKMKSKALTLSPPPVVGMPGTVSSLAQAFGFAPASALEERKIVSAKQMSSDFVLDDGTTLTVRPVLIDVKRAKDQWGPNGKPMYILTMTNLTETESPRKLMDPRFIGVATNKKRKKGARR